jgi:cytochrome c biogenesis factor
MSAGRQTKVALSMVATVFMPLSFMVGIFGTNLSGVEVNSSCYSFAPQSTRKYYVEISCVEGTGMELKHKRFGAVYFA